MGSEMCIRDRFLQQIRIFYGESLATLLQEYSIFLQSLFQCLYQSAQEYLISFHLWNLGPKAKHWGNEGHSAPIYEMEMKNLVTNLQRTGLYTSTRHFNLPPPLQSVNEVKDRLAREP